MKDIKFRAWDKEEKEMVYNVQKDDICEEYYGCSFSDLLETPKRFILMLYTGLKDKNNKRIYEGDIVLHTDWNNKHRNDFQVLEIGTIDGPEGRPSILPCFPLQQRCTVYDFSMDTNKLIVTGNIYKNPDLLLTQQK